MLVEFAPNLYIRESWLRFYGVRLQTRMTVVRLASGLLFVHSPTALDPSTRSELDRLGPVGFVVSPNKIHNQAIGQYAEAYPSAKVFASPGLVERRPNVRFDGVLGNEPEPEWAADLDLAATGGNVFFSEILFFHRSTRTLIAADLIENLHRETTSLVGCGFIILFRGYGRPVASPEFRFYTTDADAAKSALRKVQAWDYERIVLSHGRLIEENARAVLQAAYDDVFRKVRARWAWTNRLYTLLARVQ